MDGELLIGFAKVIGISLVPVALFGAALHARGLLEKGTELGRRAHVIPPAVPAVTGRPLEKLAADLRRLRAEVRSPRPGVAMAKQRGIVAAYDEVLVETSKALGVPTTLGEVPEGLDHEAERLRLEHALEQAGLSWRVRRP
jgi:hypothetical protein